MTAGISFLQQYMYALGQFLINPLLYVFILFIYLHYRKQMALERQLFAVRIQSPLPQTLRSVVAGLMGGLFVSIASGLLGLYVQVADVWLVWVLALVLAFFRLRYLCLAYASGLLTFLHGVALLIPALAEAPGIGSLWSLLLAAKPLPLLALVALLHVVEAAFVRWNAGQDASPMFISGRRGRIVGAYQLHSFWLTPLIILVPSQTGEFGLGALFQGWPVFASGDLPLNFGFLLIPAITGFSAMTQSMTPERKAEHLSAQLVWYSVILFALAYATVWVPQLLWLTALFGILGHEGLAYLSQYREDQSQPYFVPSSRGLKVMAVIPHSPAEEMGILPGEIIVKVNGHPIREKSQLYPALQANSAFCKMEVLTYDNEIKFTQTAVYAGRHHQLGIIVVPDADTVEYVDIRNNSILKLLKQRMQKMNMGA
ncbi:PDZ domain-containing protein [Brevibacillus dissolubilis]|uniref:PDZ domain-containing protein n=1 Tax=Brevibacillus dissolubilis TaxID=1844116 RepID=UPI00111660A2|nr:PDZ domain-containing protein [Brevibacillus dissolubilis]